MYCQLWDRPASWLSPGPGFTHILYCRRVAVSKQQPLIMLLWVGEELNFNVMRSCWDLYFAIILPLLLILIVFLGDIRWLYYIPWVYSKKLFSGVSSWHFELVQTAYKLLQKSLIKPAVLTTRIPQLLGYFEPYQFCSHCPALLWFWFILFFCMGNGL